ncbi:MAG: DUF2764 family protein [Saprospiraceae bacterium]|nr:DUF2764 family protein [Saprospiraceae bacterium]
MLRSKVHSSGYYYLVSGLPDISFGKLPEGIKLKELLDHIYEELSEEDKSQVSQLFLKYDNKMLLDICAEKTPENYLFANYSAEHFTELLKSRSDLLPSYQMEFFENCKEQPKENFFEAEMLLTRKYYEYIILHSKGLLKEWIIYEMQLLNLLTGLNAASMGISAEEHMVGDDEVTQRIVASKAPDFGLSLDFPYIVEIIKLRSGHDFVELERYLDFIKWEKLEELSAFSNFSVDFVLAYLLKLMIAMRWTQLDEKKGQEVLDNKLEQFKNNIKHGSEAFIFV